MLGGAMRCCVALGGGWVLLCGDEGCCAVVECMTSATSAVQRRVQHRSAPMLSHPSHRFRPRDDSQAAHMGCVPASPLPRLAEASHETTAKLLTWAVYLLARYPDWQKRVREEVWRVMGREEMPEGGGGGGANREGGGEKLGVGGEKGEGGGEGEKEEGGGEAAKGNRGRGGGRKVTWEQVGRLSEMHMVLLETLRLFPPTPVITREASKHVSLGPYWLPAGTRITMAIGMVQSDPRFWGEDALEFNPARFKDGIQGACSHPQAFLPFSAGPRDCIGSNFALSEAKVVLAHMLNRLEWELSPTYVHLPTMGIALSPKYGMPLRMRLVE
ncbi:unnamed protein product [Closterium sp. NIES-53]